MSDSTGFTFGRDHEESLVRVSPNGVANAVWLPIGGWSAWLTPPYAWGPISDAEALEIVGSVAQLTAPVLTPDEYAARRAARAAAGSR